MTQTKKVKKHKKLRIILAVILILIAALVITGIIVYQSIEKNLDHLTTIDIGDVDLNAIDDGTYDGSYKAMPISVKLTVMVRDHKIAAINLIEHMSGQGKPAEAVIADVLKYNSLQVDAVTGATYSSKVILLAIQDALKNAASAS